MKFRPLSKSSTAMARRSREQGTNREAIDVGFLPAAVATYRGWHCHILEKIGSRGARRRASFRWKNAIHPLSPPFLLPLNGCGSFVGTIPIMRFFIP
jgi:hypothetical protein